MLETSGVLTADVRVLRMISLQLERISSHLSGMKAGMKAVSVIARVKMSPSDREKVDRVSGVMPMTYQS